MERMAWFVPSSSKIRHASEREREIISNKNTPINRWATDTFLECLFVRFRGSLENCTLPRLTRYELFDPASRQIDK